jgi:hypothetical protein
MGRHGNTLVADIALGAVLRSREPIICIVAPCAPEQLDTQRDSRLGELLEQADRQQAVFVAKPHIAGERNRHWPPASYTISSHPEEVLPLLHLILEQLENAHRMATHRGTPPEAPTAQAGAHSREGACSSLV